MYIKSGGSWKSIQDFYIKVSGVWKAVNEGYIKVSGAWKKFWSSALSIAQQVTIAQSTDATTFLITLTGTNYHWSPSTATLKYFFERSTDGGTTWPTTLNTGSITNPAFGLSNTKTYLLPAAAPNIGVLPDVLNYYRFRVYATHGALTENSISALTVIQGPTDTTISLANPTFGSVELSWTASTGANRYLVYKSTDNSIFSQYASVPSGTTSIFGISDLAGGNTYYFYVVPVTGGSFTYPGYYGNNSNTLTLPILATPTLSAATSLITGFSFNIENYNASNTYNLSTTLGSVSRSGSTVTVSSLSSGQSATVTVSATRSEYGNSNSATRTGSALVQYNITWNPNGGTFLNSSSNNETDTGPNGTITSPSSTPTRNGYTFLYWRNTPSGSYDYQVNSGGTWTIGTSGSTNVTFYARWQLNAPSNISAPVVTPSSGTAGSTQFSSTTGSWSGVDITYTYQWQYNDQGSTWLAAPGTSTNSTYTPPSNYVSLYGSSLRCRVTATNGSGSPTASSNTVTVNAPVIAPTNASSPTLSPTSLFVGTQLSAGIGTWNNSPTGYDIRIYRGTQNVATFETLVAQRTGSSTANLTYTITQTDYDSGQRYFRTFVDASNSAGSSGLIAGQERGPIQVAAPSNTAAPSVTPSSGTAGSTQFSCSTGSWTNSPTSYAYQWQYLDQGSTYLSISGATSSTYTPPSNYVSLYGSSLRCRVTATNAGGSASANSNVVTVSTGGSVPATPTGVTNTYNGGTSYTFSWTASSGATSYDINYGENTTAPSPNPPSNIVGNVTTNTINVTSTSYNYTSSSSSNYVGFRVRAKNSNGSSSYSAVTQYK